MKSTVRRALRCSLTEVPAYAGPCVTTQQLNNNTAGMERAPERPTSRSTLLALVVTCMVVFTVGVILLVVGFFKFTSPYPKVPYMWSITLCRVNGTERWVGMELQSRQDCPFIPKDGGESQSIKIPPGILIASVPYVPVIYVTNKGNSYSLHAHIIELTILQ